MKTSTEIQLERKPLATLCILAVLALLFATQYPFNPIPKNEVTWLADAEGLGFGYVGIASTDTPLLPRPGDSARAGCTIELWLRSTPDQASGDILSFSSVDKPEAITVRQWRETLFVLRATANRPGPLEKRSTAFFIGDVLQKGRLVFVTIVSGPHGTIAYIDGKETASAPGFRIYPADLYRRIVIGAGTTSAQAFLGEMHGLAVYDVALDPAEVYEHYAYWLAGETAAGARGALEMNGALARYEFRERGGNEIHSAVLGAPPIRIPAHFAIPYKRMLDDPVDEFQANWIWGRDVLENLIGFMPLGVVLAAYFALSRSRKQSILLVWLCGACLSFTIEFSQYFVPRRGSGWTDVITNSTGALLGALVVRPEWVWGGLRLVKLVPAKASDESPVTGG